MNKDEITQYYNDQALAGKKKRDDEEDEENEEGIGADGKHEGHNHNK